MKSKQTLVCGTRNLCFALAAIFALAFIACDDGSGDDKTGGKKFTVTFDSNGGSDVSSQTVAEGGKATKPADPTKAFTLTAGLYEGTPPTHCTFAGWQKGGAAYDFNTPVTANITLTATWPVPSINLLTRDEANIIAKSVAYINADDSGATEYTLALDADVENVATIIHDKDGVTLTVTSVDTTKRTISKGTENGTVFTVGGADTSNPSSAKLVIDGNITLQGKAVNNTYLVNVQYGGRLELKGSAKITGNANTTATPNGGGGGVYAQGNQGNPVTITMSDNAEISNNTAAIASNAQGGGVKLYGFANFTMSDNAAIKNNTSSGATGSEGGGVYIGASNSFTMNGGEISGNSATNTGSSGSTRGGGVYIGYNSDSTTQFIVASEAVKANIKDNTAARTGDGTNGQGPQVYKNGSTIFKVGGVDASTF